MKQHKFGDIEHWASLGTFIGTNPANMSRRESQVSEISALSESSFPIPCHFSSSSVEPSPNARSSASCFKYEFSPTPHDSSKSPTMFRHHRHPSNASEASSNAPCLDAFSSSYSNQVSTTSPALSQDDVPNSGGSSYVEEPLPMEGEFASMDLRSSPGNYHNFLAADGPVASDGRPLRFDTLTWAKAHACPEPRQETMLTTGGLRPKSSISSLTAMLEGQHHDQSLSAHSQAYQYDHFSPSRRSSSQFGSLISSPNLSPGHDLSVSQSACLSPACKNDANQHQHQHQDHRLLQQQQQQQPPSVSDFDQKPIINLSPANPTSPSLRLNMNHPDMPSGPSISLTSATPLTARPGPGTGSSDFQKVLEDMVQAQSSPSGSSQQPRPAEPEPLPEDRLSDLLFNSAAAASFLDPRPTRHRQRSKSESIAKQNSSPQFTFDMPPCTGMSSIFPSLGFDVPGSASEEPLSGDLWAALQQGGLSPLPAPTLQPVSPAGPGGDSTGSGTPLSDARLHSLFNPLGSRRSVAVLGYDLSLLQPIPCSSSSRRSHSVSHGHRRGRSEGILGNMGPGAGVETTATSSDFRLASENLLAIPSLSSGSRSISRTGLGPSESSGLGMPDPSWVSSFPIIGSSYAQSELGDASPVASDRCLTNYSPRPRSHSHSSFESGETAASGIPIEYKSRTTAATKAAAAKRRKEGVAARYMCDMCGETFTRRYNLRGHQRAHKGEKPFECGYPGCASRFARAHDQKRHYKLHLGVKDYNCKACGKAFIRLDALQRHHKSDAGHTCFQKLQSTGHLPQDYDLNSPLLNGIYYGNQGNATDPRQQPGPMTIDQGGYYGSA